MRDNFSNIIKSIVAGRVGYRCSNPSCYRPTSGPNDEPDKMVNIGVAAHISAAAEGGPRYDPSMTSSERKSVTNAIWLCQVCAKLIDSDVSRFEVSVLREWKRVAEEKARAKIEQPSTAFDLSVMPGFFLFLESVIIFADNFYEEKAPLNIADYLAWVDQCGFNSSEEMKGIISIIQKNPAIGEDILNRLTDWIENVYRKQALSAGKIAHNIEAIFEQISLREPLDKDRHRLKVSARLLEMASRNLCGSGITVDLGKTPISLTQGTLFFRWRMGDKSNNMMLVDLVGGVLENRISVILKDDFSILARVYESLGDQVILQSQPYRSGETLAVMVIWDENNFSLWVQGHKIRYSKLTRKFDAPILMVLVGIDLDGVLSADRVIQGYEIDGVIGLNLGKDFHLPGAHISNVAIWPRPLIMREIITIVESSKPGTVRYKSKTGKPDRQM